MARLFGLIGNRADLGGRVLAFESQALHVQARGTTLGWGVGFYQGGEVLMRRRPLDDREEIDITDVAGDVRGTTLEAGSHPQCKKCGRDLNGRTSNLCEDCRLDALRAVMKGQT